ncbi:hypothetical protein ZIOFF_070479 [Zingiber officinale]|uniref:Uncharacterized protein n=1 Tax=Zingiber officinale TaxID=94328 RepID=A0A8J5BYK2_ZINOF|nr:hypothetical protein ZIOFF_070479 [Zingiber officinale]
MAEVGWGEASRRGRELEIAVHDGEAYDDASPAVAEKHISLTRLVFACMVAGGVQYGWALQLSLLTPYVQTLGLSHALSSIVWLCGPITGFVVQPIIGLWSDRCQSRFGRRRPFIFVECILISIAVIVVGFSSDMGHALGDTKEHCRWFPFLMTNACCEACANLKGAFLVAVVLLFISLTVTLFLAKEVRLCDLNRFVSVDQQNTNFFDVLRAFKNLPPGMHSVLLVTALTWLSWFPFILYNTDWMGREIYYGNPKGTNEQSDAYDRGVREGALGLLLNSVVLTISSFSIAPMCRKLGTKVVWAISNLILFVCMAAICIIGIWSSKEFHSSAQPRLTADPTIRIVALAFFTILGFPLAVVYSVPFAVTAQLTANVEGGQGLCAGVLNNSIIIPQVIVALGAGPWDALFGKGNMPAFALASVTAFVCSIVGLLILPQLSKSNFKISRVSGGH